MENVELEHQLIEVGNKLSNPLFLLDQVERLLLKVDQSPKKTMLDALKPTMKALIQDHLLRHSDVDVKVAVASCISQITRITAPDAPYDNDQMRDVFQLIVSSFEDLADTSSRSYIRRTSILETVSKVRSCVIMLDLKCNEMIVEMFEHFLRSVRDYHRGVIYSSMENIMILVLEESKEISVEMLKPLLATVKKHNEGVLSIAQKLGEDVLKKSAEKLKPYLMPALTALDDSLDSYIEIVSQICEGTTAATNRDDENASGKQREVKRPATIDSSWTSSKRKCTPVKDKLQESDTIKYDESLIGKKVKVWWPEDKMYYEGVIESFEVVKKKHKVSYVNGYEENLYLKNQKWAIIQKFSTRDKLQESDSIKYGERLLKRRATIDSSSDSDLKPQKQAGKKIVFTKEVRHPTTIDSSNKKDHKPQKHGKKAVVTKEVKLPATANSSGTSSKRKRTPVKDKESETIKYDKSLVGKIVKVWWPEDKMYYEGVVRSFDAVKKKHKVSYVNGDEKNLYLKNQKWAIIQKFSTRDKLQESDSIKYGERLLKRRATIDSSNKNDHKPQKHGKKAVVTKEVKLPATANASGTSSKRKRTPVKDKESETIKYDKSLVGKKVKVWWPEDRVHYEGVIESFDAATKEHRVLYLDGEEESLYLKKELWAIIQNFSAQDKDKESDSVKFVESLVKRPTTKDLSSDSDLKTQKQAGKKAGFSKEVIRPATIDSPTDSDLTLQKQAGKKAVVATIDSSSDSDLTLQKQAGKKAVVATIDSSSDSDLADEATDSDEEPPLKISKKLEPVNSWSKSKQSGQKVGAEIQM